MITPLLQMRSIAVALVMVGGLMITLTPARASLIGDTITGAGLGLAPTTDGTIQEGVVEFKGLFEGIDFDFGASSLTVTSLSSTGFARIGDYVFSGFDSTITNVSILSNTGFTGSILNFSFTANSITLDMFLEENLPIGSVLVFNIQTAASSVPEHGATAAMLGLALIGLAAARRKRPL